ncbi:aldo/keto reductase family protein [Endozoicomonas ascidiicola]|uniref:aldo/keto reductase family protein n=1 Tax=Endozoicomonas ascidiicola TaxID=1698521 RepID=UPI0008301D2A|nr:aldo/keto reductase [Endozoicomonas ascidiicola]
MTDLSIIDPLPLHDTLLPKFIYGTAWKEAATKDLTLKALENGFTAIDTANQRKHYFEQGVGEALQHFYHSSGTSRDQLFLQSKFTYKEGQDERLPYDVSASYTTQVEQSFLSSLEHLGTDYLDAYLLHGPSQREGLSERDFEVWEAMESFYRSGHIKLLGVSNMSHDQLEYLQTRASIKPMLVQNRCFAHSGWDTHVRELCLRHGIHYQGFSLLTANTAVFKQPDFLAIMQRTGLTAPQIIFQFALKVGMVVLTGTSNEKHMQEDLHCMKIPLMDEEIITIEQLMMTK